MAWVLALAGTARADDAKQLFDEGRALAADGNYIGACEKLTRSFEIDPEPGTELNLANCHVHLGHVAKAWHLFDDAAQRWNHIHDQREKYARDHADALVPQLSTVIVRVADPTRSGLAITIGGHAAAAEPEIRELVDPGPVDVVVTAPGVARFSRSASPVAGQTITIEVPAFASPAAPLAEPPDPRRPRLYLAAGLAGAGVIALGVAAIISLEARSDYLDIQMAHCPTGDPPVCDSPMSAQLLTDAADRAGNATYFAVAGAVLAGAGVVVYLTAPRAIAVTPTATATSAGVEISGRF